MKLQMAQAGRSSIQSAWNHIILYRAQPIGYCCMSSQWACWTTAVSICCRSAARFQKPSTFPSSTCIDLLMDLSIAMSNNERVVMTERIHAPKGLLGTPY